MRRHFTRALSPVLPLALLLGCPTTDPGDDPIAIESLFPKNNEVGSWVEDTTKGQAGVQVASNYTEAWQAVDGDAESFEQGMVAFGWEFYTNTTHTLELRVWQLKDAATCTSVYDSLVVDDPLYTSNTWTDVSSLGAAGRVADTGTQWWHNSRKAAYHIETKTMANDATGQDEAEKIINAVLAKIP
ncbi:MAG: hypothetical protein ABIJ09_12085 [Pseudomonadota bacterium]